MSSTSRTTTSMDPWTISMYVLLVLVGWLLIYSSEYTGENDKAIYDLELKSGRQLMWIGTCGLVLFISVFLNYRFYDSFAYFLYLVSMLVLVGVLFFGKEVAGSRSWIDLGFGRLQPSELAKYTTILMLAKFLSHLPFRFHLRNQLLLLTLMLLPMGLIVAQGDVGTAMVFLSLLFMLNRAGMPPFFLLLVVGFVGLGVLTLSVPLWLLLAGIFCLTLLFGTLWSKDVYKVLGIVASGVVATGFVLSTEYVMTRWLKPYQYKRIQSLLNPNLDPLGTGWNVTQSKIAIGSGGLSGKGYLRGTQTRFDFVPEESTDFIFCTLGEEFGWIGTTGLVLLFALFLLRLLHLAERQKNAFSMLFGYGVVCIFFAHYALNIAMTLGLFPVIGIPLPFLSYGGSSLLSFTLMLTTLLTLDAHRGEVVSRW